MHAVELLHKHIKITSREMNKATLGRLLQTAEAVLYGGKLSLTHLGRNLSGRAQVKHKIKSVDRLLGNRKLYTHRQSLYRAMSLLLIGSRKRIELIVDWSPYGNRHQQMLRASLCQRGRSMVVYEEVHAETKTDKRKKIHREFLGSLKEILPKDVEVTILTDAGFKTDWFKEVRNLDWDFEGRVRGNIYYSKEGKAWEKAVFLYKEATQTPTYIGQVRLGKKSMLPCEMYLYKGKTTASKKEKRAKLSSRTTKKFHKAEDARARKKLRTRG